MYFIIWSNYDENDIMQIEDKEVAEKEIAEIKALEDADEYGTHLEMVIEGKEVKYKTIEVTSKVILGEE